MLVLAIAVGLLIGLSLGALGGGGSILTVPALVYLLGQSPHQATTASLLVVGTAAITGAVSHARARRARLKIGAIFGLLGIAGSYAGSLASAAVPANLLLAGFGMLMLTVAATMMLRRRVQGESAPAGHPRGGTRHIAVVAAAATGVGLVTGFFGVGGGFVVVPALVLALGFDMPTAAGTSLVVIVVDSAAALAARTGHAAFSLDWPLVAAFTAAAVLGTLAGTRLAGRVNPQRLSAAFTLLIITVAGYTLARSLPGVLVAADAGFGNGALVLEISGSSAGFVLLLAGAVWLDRRLRPYRGYLRYPARAGGVFLFAVAAMLAWLSLAFGAWTIYLAVVPFIAAISLEAAARRRRRQP